MDNQEQTTVVTVEVTEEEYQADLARGLAEDEVLHPGQHVFQRGGFLARRGLQPDQQEPPVKVHISVDLDQDVFDFIKERVREADMESIETQINEMLRAVMEEEARTQATPYHPTPRSNWQMLALFDAHVLHV